MFDSKPFASGLIGSARLRNLRTGHSHEDVDQLFGRLATFVARHARVAASPADFRDIIQHWLDDKLDRPHEPLRRAILMDQCRDWILIVTFSTRFSLSPRILQVQL